MSKRKLLITLALASILAIILSAAFLVMLVGAANPIITSRFAADPAPYYFAGKVYMYNTDDQSNSGVTWDSTSWRAYSSTDLVNWTDEGAFWKVGAGGFTWASTSAWAPAATYKNGYYWIYLPVDAGLNQAGTSKIGVIRCTTPTSGCIDPLGRALIQEGRDANAGGEAIDPFIFVDDDGTPYLYFHGAGQLKLVKLNADMISLNGAITNVTVTNYIEGAWVHKYNGVYYLSYSSGWPGPIQYSTSASPLGPWTFRGNILPNPSPSINTNHHGILNYNGQWFLFYHKALTSGAGNYKRQSAIECMYYLPDGSIPQVGPTIAGVTSTSCGAPTYYRLGNQNSGKVLGIYGSSTANGAGVVQWTATGSYDQDWWFQPADGEYFSILNRNSGKCLDVTGTSTANGAVVQQWECWGGANQQWKKVATTAPYFQLVNRNSGKVLDVAACATADGGTVDQWDWLNNACQQWQQTTASGATSTPAPTNTPVSTVYYSIANVKSAKVMDVPGCSTANSTQLNQWPWLNNNCQKFQFVTNGSYYNIKNANSGKCLDVTSASTADGAKIVQYTCGTGTNQQFSWAASGSYYQLKARHSGKCVNVVGSSTADGALLEQRACSAVTNMQWTRTAR